MNGALTGSNEYNVIGFTARCFDLCIDNNLCESITEDEEENEKWFYWWLLKEPNGVTYIVLVRMRIGWPKNAGTFSSISEWVFMKFNVTSGSVRESLWHEPGRGSGICVGERWKIIYFFFVWIVIFSLTNFAWFYRQQMWGCVLHANRDRPNLNHIFMFDASCSHLICALTIKRRIRNTEWNVHPNL